jgi:hypothetical protein
MIHSNLKLDWTNISLQEYIELQDLLLDNEEQLEQEDLIMQEIQILYGRNPYTMQMPEFKKCIDGLKFMQKEMPKMKVKEHYNLGGNIYYLHKKLEQFKVGQYIDYEHIMKEGKGVEIYADFIALFLTPNEDDSYGDGYDVAQVIADIKKYMSIADANSITAFFLKSCKLYTILSLLYSNRKARKTIKNRKTRKTLKKKTMELVNLVLNGESYR